MHHKDLEAWKKSMQLVKDVYVLVDEFPETERYILTNQICRSAISIPSNIAEGCARETDKDTLHYLNISLGSSAELETQLLIAEELGYCDSQKALEKLDNVNALIYGLKKYLKNKQRKDMIT